jgi:hypothetical protein
MRASELDARKANIATENATTELGVFFSHEGA